MTDAPLNILLVDDKPENLVALEELLRQPDRALFKASSGNDALRLLLKHKFAVVLLDVEMPGMDGYETAQLMRGVEQTRLVPIIFVTAGDRSDERTFRGYEAGAVDFLYKPVNAFMLRCKVDVFVELYRKSEELARLNAQLERTTGALRDKVLDLEHVTRTLSHDLRAPLRSINGFAGALQGSLAGKLEPEDDAYLQRIVRAGTRLGRMLDDLYAMLRVDGAAVGAAAGADEVAVADVLADVTETLRRDLDAAGATVTHGELPTLRVNRMLLAQVLQNLIANAVKFRAAEPPRIHVGAEHVGTSWQFSVTDNGTGIAPGDRARVFELFQRASSDAVPGSGVGLALCKRAVDKLGGTISVKPAPAGGSVFEFTVAG
jgi:hypothetical protein